MIVRTTLPSDGSPTYCGVRSAIRSSVPIAEHSERWILQKSVIEGAPRSTASLQRSLPFLATHNEVKMSGRQRLPAGEPRKASQRRTRRSAPSQGQIGRVWNPGDMVQWRDRIGNFRRHLDDGEHAEIVIADRTYRVRVGDLV
jgi:hypothetical protein